MTIFEDLESEVRGYCRDYPVVFTSARGSELVDEQGETYIDFLAGAGTLNYGHNHPQIKRAVIDYWAGDGVVHGLDMHTRAKERFLKTFKEVILEPRGMDYKVQFPGPTGTNAVEAAMKLARKITGRHTIVSFTNGFHGMSLGALAATGNGHHRGGAGVPLTGTAFMPYDGYLGQAAESIAMIDKYLSDPSSGLDKPAAMIVETVQGEGGVNVASVDWLRDLQAVCRRHDVLLIVDDIQVGNGRTGRFFSFEDAEIEPDIVLLSKSIGAIGLPMALVLMRRELDRWAPGEHNGTFRGNNLAFVAATEAIERYWRDDAFAKDVRRKGAILRQHLQWLRADHPVLKLDVRGRGMIWGIEFDHPDAAGMVVEEAFQRKLIIENCGSGGKVIKFLGALTMSDEILEEGLRRLGDAVAAVADKIEQEMLQEAAK